MTIETLIAAIAILWPVAVWAVRYPDSVLRLVWRERRTLTWHFETLIIGTISACLVVASGGGHLQWLAWAGGMWGHGSRSVGRRMYEAQAREAAERGTPAVHCWRAQRHYSYRGALTFAAVNIALGWYGALAAIALGVAYDWWRELRMRRRTKAERRELIARRAGIDPDLRAKLLVGYSMGLTPAESERKLHVVRSAPTMGVWAAIAHLRELADQEEQAAAAVLMAADHARQPNESEQHDHAAAVLRAAAADIERRASPGVRP